MPRLHLAILIALCLATVPAAGAGLSGRLTLQGGYLDHPLGIADEQSSPYAGGSLFLQWLHGERTRWRLTYSGSGTVFDPEVELDDTRHALGVEWIRPAPRAGWTLSAGARGSVRRQTGYFTVYDHEEAYGYLAFKHYPRDRVMLRGWAGMRARSYDALPEESYLEPHVILEAKRFGDSRSTLGATLRIGGKWFHDPVAPRVWATDGTPVTAQARLGLQAAQGLSDRFGARASASLRVGLQGFPYYVAEDLYDSPLLDRYARTGPSALAAVKWLSPWQAWVELGGNWIEDDYGDILFPDPLGGSVNRRDTIVGAFLSVERRWLKHGEGVVLRVRVSWRDQDSSAVRYTWSGPSAWTGLEWRF